jgi:hypothetical protein
MAATPIAVNPTGGNDDDGEPRSDEPDETADPDGAGELIDSSVP